MRFHKKFLIPDSGQNQYHGGGISVSNTFIVDNYSYRYRLLFPGDSENAFSSLSEVQKKSKNLYIYECKFDKGFKLLKITFYLIL